MAASSLFRKQDLRLLRSVPARDLTCDGGPPSADGVLDYLVCRGEDALAAVSVLGRDEWLPPEAAVPGLPALTVLVEQLEAGEVAELLASLDSCLDRPTAWRCPLAAIPEAEQQDLCRRRLLRETETGVELTEFGAFRGVVKQAVPGGAGRLLYSPGTARLLAEKPESSARMMRAGARIPFRQRCERIRFGMRANPRDSAVEVRRLMKTPLEVWMEDFPVELEQLRRHLSYDCVTYGEAAWETGYMLCSGETALFDEAVEMMQLLAAPSVQYTMADMGLEMIERMRPGATGGVRRLGQANAAPSGKAVSFSQRTAGIRSAEVLGQKLCQMPMHRFFQGVAAACRMDYPLWLSRMLRRFFSVPDIFAYGHMLHHAATLMDSFLEDGTPDWDDWSTGVCVLYLLMIEPVCLIHQNSSISENGDDNDEQ